MSSAPSGYPNNQKLDRINTRHAGVEPRDTTKDALSVLTHQYVYVVGTDAVDSATTSVITAASHAALRGDVIRFTSGTYSGRDYKVWDTATNTITLCEDLSTAPAALDTFQILRHRYPVVDSTGNLIANLTEGATAATGDILPDLVKVVAGYDGTAVRVLKTDTSGILTVGLPSGAATLAEQQTQTTALQLIDDVIGASGSTPPTKGVLILGSDGVNARTVTTDTDGYLQIDVLTSALPSGAATLAEQQTQTTALQLIDDPVATVGSAITTKAFAIAGTDGADARILKTDTGGELQVDVLTSGLPTGAATLAEQQTQTTALQLIDDSVATIGSAITAKGFTVAGTDGTNARAIKTDSNGELQVDVLTLPNVTLNMLDVVDFIDTTPILDTSITNIPASGSAPVTIVANLAATTKRLRAADTTGAFIGVYSDPAGTPVLEFIINPGMDNETDFAASGGTVLGLRSMTASAISSGLVCIQFYG